MGQRIVHHRALGALLALILIAVAAAPLGAQAPQIERCPEITDTITRLEYALLGRPPAPTVAYSWASVWQTGERDIVDIADHMADSTEFQAAHPDASDAEFVSILVENVAHRPPTTLEREYWYDALRNGVSRGTMALTLTETPEFVAATATARPLAGYHRWYPPGARWYCGIGPDQVAVVDIGDNTTVDYFAINTGGVPATVQFSTYAGGERQTVIGSGTIEPGYSLLNWDQMFVGDGYYGNVLNVASTPGLRWAVVFYPGSLGPYRLGWQIESTD